MKTWMMLAGFFVFSTVICAHAQQIPQDTIGQAALAQEICTACMRGEPRDRCKSFFITEYILLYQVQGMTTVNPDLGLAMGSEAGWMRNIGERTAVGGTVFAFGDSPRLGVKLRYRRWLSRKFAADVGIGTVLVDDTDEQNGRRVASLELSWTDRFLLTLQYESVKHGVWDINQRRYTGSTRASELYAGAKIGSGLGLTATIVELVGLMLVLSSM